MAMIRILSLAKIILGIDLGIDLKIEKLKHSIHNGFRLLFDSGLRTHSIKFIDVRKPAQTLGFGGFFSF